MKSTYQLVATQDRDAFHDEIDKEEKSQIPRSDPTAARTCSEWTGYRTFILAGVCLIVGAMLGSWNSPRKMHVSLPKILDEVRWDRSLSGLRSDEYVGGDTVSRKLKKDVVILDVDTRPWRFDPANMTQLDWGRLNHYLYARIHGYDYRFLEVNGGPSDQHYTWVKVKGIHQVLDEGYKYVVFSDGDVVFHNLKIPVEYMLSHWNVTSDIAVTVGQCQDRKDRYDRTHHKVSVNSGFMIVQRTDVTDQLLQDWEECPTEVKYKGCAHWAKGHWHEQSAYSDYVRYDYPGRTREVSCDEVTGSPAHPTIDGKHCDGRLVRHYSADKNAVKEAVEAAITNILLPDIVNELRELGTTTRVKGHA